MERKVLKKVRALVYGSGFLVALITFVLTGWLFNDNNNGVVINAVLLGVVILIVYLLIRYIGIDDKSMDEINQDIESEVQAMAKIQRDYAVQSLLIQYSQLKFAAPKRIQKAMQSIEDATRMRYGIENK